MLWLSPFAKKDFEVKCHFVISCTGVGNSRSCNQEGPKIAQWSEFDIQLPIFQSSILRLRGCNPFSQIQVKLATYGL